ncbi:hypothetical protein [Marinitenerispora sediminis]|uniref:Uncharacterized protein n=1 Tax=Marinitenerispora sediminis TaxID=1931232 RepID=A0A368T9N3_9ACTN|nr:hypothetical protein [Marinitenerispora sediminis]RCV52803.1 hypothetical protein DEF28_12100 [Marinitenerispora sediminis]RCV59908.1 hypothetical protein DEF23_06080 [Marinitenerispora sediminis]RCV61324.1 hypothetical protein DEF24_04615 [Marinitenerispora sediminis]
MKEIHLHEIRRCGPAAIVLPLLGAFVAVAAVGAASTRGPGPAGWAVAGATAGLPLLAGAAVVSVLDRERSFELLAGTPVPVPTTMRRRLAVVAGCVTAGALAVASAASAAGAVGGPAAAVLLLPAMLAPALLVGGTAAWAWTRRRSAAPASGAAVAVWLGHTAWWAPSVPDGLAWAVAAAVGAVLLRSGARAIADMERLPPGGAGSWRG